MAFNNSLAIGADTFERLTDGRWILSTATADEPIYFQIDSTISPDSVSSYVVRKMRYKNNALGGQDDLLQAHTVIRCPLKAFSQANIEADLATLSTFLSPANLTKLLRGER